MAWETFREYLDVARPPAEGHQLRRLRRPLGAAHLGHGRAGLRPTRPRADDLAGDAARAGATRSTPARSASPRRGSDHHQTSDDRPVASRLAAWDEVEALVGMLAARRRRRLRAGPRVGDDVGPTPRRAPRSTSRLRAAHRRHRRPDDLRRGRRGRPAVRGSDQLDLLDRRRAHGGRMFGQSHMPRRLGHAVVQDHALPFDHLPGVGARSARSRSTSRPAAARPGRARAASSSRPRRADYRLAPCGAEARSPTTTASSCSTAVHCRRPDASADAGRPTRRRPGRGDDRPGPGDRRSTSSSSSSHEQRRRWTSVRQILRTRAR